MKRFYSRLMAAMVMATTLAAYGCSQPADDMKDMDHSAENMKDLPGMDQTRK